MFSIYLGFVLLCLVLYLIQVIRSSRIRRLLSEFPADSEEIPLFGASFKLLARHKDTMTSLINIAKSATRAGGAIRYHAMHILFFVVLTDAEESAALLKTSLDKGYLYSFLTLLTGDGSAFAPASVAKVRRRLLLPFVTPKKLNIFFDIFYEESVRLARALDPLAGTGPFPAERLLSEWSFETLLKTLGVSDVDCAFKSTEFFNALKKTDEIAYNRISSIWKHPDFVFKLLPNYREYTQMKNIAYKNAYQVLQNLRRNRKLYSQLEKKTNKDEADNSKESVLVELLESNLNDQQVCEEIIILLGATALNSLAMGYVLMLLGQYTSVQDKVTTELEGIFGASDRPMTRDDLTKLVYMDMVIKESLRLYPPAPLLVRKVVTDVTLRYKYGLMAMKIALCTILRKYRIVGEPAVGPEPRIRTKYDLFMKPLDNFTINIVHR